MNNDRFSKEIKILLKRILPGSEGVVHVYMWWEGQQSFPWEKALDWIAAWLSSHPTPHLPTPGAMEGAAGR